MFLDILIKNLNNSIYRYPEALKYLYSRNVTDEEIKLYNIGFNKIICIPEDVGDDRARMVEECRKGWILERKIIFPFKNVVGNMVGLIGRSIEAKRFKIFVTEDAKLLGFFFGLYQALPYIYELGRVFVVEGPFDCLALSKVFPNTVASLTSGISKKQYEYLRFYTDSIITVFDTDEAGKRGRDIALRRKGVSALDLLSYKDPDECLMNLKLPAFKKFIKKQLPLF